MKKINSNYTKFIQDLAKIANNSGLDEIEFKEDETHIKIIKNRGYNPQNVATTLSPAPITTYTNTVGASNITEDNTQESINEEVDYSKHSGALLSPMVGVVYTAPEPESEDYVKIGDTVKEGDTVLLIEAMKVFNPIKAHKSGTISKILVSSAQAVEFNEALIIIE